MGLADQISNWIKIQVEEAGAKGVVVGLSGGVDSSTAGLWQDQTDEGELGITYKNLDKALVALESGDTADLQEELVAKVKGLIKKSFHKRSPVRIFRAVTD